MKLYLALAVLMLALVAFSEAQDATMEERFAQFSDKVTELGRDIAEKAKTTFEEFQNSEFATKSKSWFEEQFQKLQRQVQGNTQ